MRHTATSLAARLVKLEEKHAPTLALAAEVRLFGPDGERLDSGASPIGLGKLRPVINVHMGARVEPEVEHVVPSSERPTASNAAAMPIVEPVQAQTPPAASISLHPTQQPRNHAAAPFHLCKTG